MVFLLKGFYPIFTMILLIQNMIYELGFNKHMEDER